MKAWQRGLIVIVVGVGLGGLGSGYVLYQKQHASTPVPSVSFTPTPQAPELTTWNDPAGFSFQYPKTLSFNKHDEDTQNYAHLEFTSKDNPGTLIVWAKDLPAGRQDTTAAWVKADKRFSGVNIIDTTLGGLPAKKAVIQKMLVTGIVDENIVFTIESTIDDSGYWSKVHDTIASSFKFTTTGESSAGAPEEAVDEEETIQ